MQIPSNLTGVAALYASTSVSDIQAESSSSTTSSTTSPADAPSPAAALSSPTSLLSSSTLLAMLNSANGGSETAPQQSAQAAYSSNLASDPQFMDVTGIAAKASQEVSPGVYSTQSYAVSGSDIAAVENEYGVVAVQGTLANGQVGTNGDTLWMANGDAASTSVTTQFWNTVDKIGYDNAQSGVSSSSGSVAKSLNDMLDSKMSGATKVGTMSSSVVAEENALLAAMQAHS